MSEQMSLYLCNNNHTQIAYLGIEGVPEKSPCPMCTIIDEMADLKCAHEYRMEDKKQEISDLIDQIKETRSARYGH